MTCMHHILKAITNFRPAQGVLLRGRLYCW